MSKPRREKIGLVLEGVGAGVLSIKFGVWILPLGLIVLGVVIFWSEPS